MIADVVRRMLKNWVTLGDISLVLLNLIKKIHIYSVHTPSPNVHAVNIHIFSLFHQLQLLLTLMMMMK